MDATIYIIVLHFYTDIMYHIDSKTIKESDEARFQYYNEILQNKKKQVLVAVLGDVGRSPRMQYHAVSLSQMSMIDQVFLLGYEGEKCIDAIEGYSLDNDKSNGNKRSSSKISQFRISTFNKVSSIWKVIPNIVHASK